MNRKLRALVVEDSVTVRERLKAILASDPGIEVVGEAADGRRAIELCGELRPDIITLDMMLPVMTGVAATEYIMAHFPTPILIVSASTNRGELFNTYDALAAGAVDVLEKPRGNEEDSAWETRFLVTVKLVARIKVITHPRARLNGVTLPSPPPVRTMSTASTIAAAASPAHSVVAIGASTGGPRALAEVLRAIPVGFPAPIVFVLHINEPFGSAFADWLSMQTGHRVVFAQHRLALSECAGRVFMAPPGRHLVVRGGRMQLTDDVERHWCRPSVDALFESAAVDVGAGVVACLLTGMGRDGAAGLLDVRRAGGHTIAQDEATSVVYGMPREAAMLGAAVRVLPLADIAGEIVAEIGRRREGAKG